MIQFIAVRAVCVSLSLSLTYISMYFGTLDRYLSQSANEESGDQISKYRMYLLSFSRSHLTEKDTASNDVVH